jgi:geranylgeranyl pyrophosphate synthase
MAIGDLRQAVRDEIRTFLDTEAGAYPGRQWLERALSRPGKSLSGDQGWTWGFLPLLVCEAAGGQATSALPLAVMAECFIAAADVLDDVQDADSPDGLERLCGVPTAINTGLFLLFLSQIAVHRLHAQNLPPTVITEVSRTMAVAGARACTGQQLDVEAGSDVLSEAVYTEMIGLKSGALVEGLCRAAAIVAGATPSATDLFGRFGCAVGMALQVNNDVRAVAAPTTRRGDLAAGKCTLPLVFALQQSPAPARAALAQLRPGATESCAAAERLAQMLHASGGVLYASIVADVYFEEAMTCLDQVPCSPNSQLRGFIHSARGR